MMKLWHSQKRTPFRRHDSSKRATEGKLPEQLSAEGIQVLTHTINNVAEGEAFLRRGIAGFYSDRLAPKTLSPC
jgi:hypothetical protein